MPDAPALPPECDVDFYLAAHPDLAAMDRTQAAAHFERYGSLEGRTASSVAVREAFLREVVYRQPGAMLEIAPSCSPLLRGPSVRYLDRLDADGLRATAEALGADITDCPETIHFTGGLDAVDARFDGVFASHLIERQPDLIRHLQAVDGILKPGGRYYLIVADTRYGAGALTPESSIADVYQAYHERRVRPSVASVVAHRALSTHADPARHWDGDHGTIDGVELQARVAAAIRACETDDDPGDVATWRFTPHGLRTLIDALNGLGLIELGAARIYRTPRGRFEFCAVLERD